MSDGIKALITIVMILVLAVSLVILTVVVAALAHNLWVSLT